MKSAPLLEKEAMGLPELDRAILAGRLIQSISKVPAEMKASWLEEVNSRMKAYRAGTISSVDGPSAISDLRSRFVT